MHTSTMKTVIVGLIALLFIVPGAESFIPSSGTMTAASIRSKLPDKAFRIQYSRARQDQLPGILVQTAEIPQFPALGGADVQMAVIRVFMDPGTAIPTHLHPRASELINVVEGTLKVSFAFEGLGSARVVKNTVKAGEATVIPQGLIHDVVCANKGKCLILVSFNSADYGFVSVP